MSKVRLIKMLGNIVPMSVGTKGTVLRWKKQQEYFENVRGINVGNICGSNGRKAVPLSLLGADVTVFDISEENKRYALELADFANTSIDYVVGDIYDMNLNKYAGYFDVLYL